jgi:hypothetical protein
VAAVVVLTEPFQDQLARVLAYQTTDRPLPAVVLPHPMQNIGPAGVAARAEALADAAERLLRTGVPG